MKTSLKLVLGALFFSLCLINHPAPSQASFFDSYAAIYMTAGENDTTQVTGDFSWDTKPWLYIRLKDTTSSTVGESRTLSLWTWDDPSEGRDPSYFQMESSQRDNHLWLSISDAQWDRIKQPGYWSTDASSLFHPQGTYDIQCLSGSTGFTVGNFNGRTVTPEPISAALFLIGGIAIATRKFFGKKK